MTAGVANVCVVQEGNCAKWQTELVKGEGRVQAAFCGCPLSMVFSWQDHTCMHATVASVWMSFAMRFVYCRFYQNCRCMYQCFLCVEVRVEFLCISMLLFTYRIPRSTFQVLTAYIMNVVNIKTPKFRRTALSECDLSSQMILELKVSYSVAETVLFV